MRGKSVSCHPEPLKPGRFRTLGDRVVARASDCIGPAEQHRSAVVWRGSAARLFTIRYGCARSDALYDLLRINPKSLSIRRLRIWHVPALALSAGLLPLWLRLRTGLWRLWFRNGLRRIRLRRIRLRRVGLGWIWLWLSALVRRLWLSLFVVLLSRLCIVRTRLGLSVQLRHVRTVGRIGWPIGLGRIRRLLLLVACLHTLESLVSSCLLPLDSTSTLPVGRTIRFKVALRHFFARPTHSSKDFSLCHRAFVLPA